MKTRSDPVLTVRPARRARIAAHHIGDLREKARRRLPKLVFDYVEGGSFDEVTMRANESDLAAVRLRQRGMVDISTRSMRTTIAGLPAAMPVALAPLGLAGIVAAHGEIHAARAAEAFGVPYCLSTLSACSIADVAAAVTTPFMFQLYIFKDRGVNEALVARAREAGCGALIVTMDAHVRGRRHRETKSGMQMPMRLSPRVAFDCARHPAWLWRWFTSRRKSLGNIAAFVGGAADMEACAAWVEANYRGTYDQREFEWLRGHWPGKLIVKGLLDEEEAELAVELGADAIVVSNHGGRQLDSAQSSARAMPAIRDRVGGRVELIFDGGIRSGVDILKALGLGATSCFIGRSYIYGLAAGGEAGVRTALGLLAEELDTAMALTGVNDVTRLPPRLVVEGGGRPA